MANFRQLTEDQNALCYVWLTFALLILAVVCFGVSTYQSSALYVGIVFLFLSIVTALLYIIRRQNAKHPNVSFCEAHCGCCQLCCGCCYYGDCNLCCASFCRTILCLPPLQPNLQRRRQRAMRRYSNRNALAETHVIVMNHLGYDLTIPSNVARSQARPVISSSTHAKLRRFERDMQMLFQEYSILQTNATIANSLLGDYNDMLHEHKLLSDWIENRARPDEDDIQQMKHTLKKISRNFRLARVRMEQDRSITADLSAPATFSASNPNNAIYTTDLAGLPPYQLRDPLKAFDSSGHRLTTGTPRYMDTSSSHRNSPSSLQDNHGYALPTMGGNGSVSSGLSISTQMGSVFSLSPPEDETGAPPSYEEAVSTAV